jgi:WD40 repeat protein
MYERRALHRGRLVCQANNLAFLFVAVAALIFSTPTRAESPPDIEWQVAAHGASVRSVTFSADGTMIASGADSADPTVQVRDAYDGNLLHSFPGQANGVRAVDFSPAGGLLAVGGIVPGQGYPVNSGGTDVWNLSNETMAHSFGGGFAAFSADGARLATGGLGIDRRVRVHEIPSETQTADISTGDYVYALDLAPDGQTAASTEYDGSVSLWDVETGQLLHTLYHGDRPVALAFSPDGQTLASGNLPFDGNATIKLWHVSDGQLQRTISGYDGLVHSVAFSADGDVLISAGSTPSFARRIRFWRVADGALVASLDPGAAAVYSAVFSPDGRCFIYGSSDGTVTVARSPIQPMDSDGDGDVDLQDYTAFWNCQAGPDGVPDPAPPQNLLDCITTFDSDQDADVDLQDFASLQRAFTGDN